MRNAGVDEAQAGNKIARRNINNLRYADDNTLMAESKEELKSLLMKVKEESEKVGLKLNIKNFGHLDEETMETWETLCWGAPKSLKMMTAAMKLKDTWTLELQLVLT